jgi:hypothetical protein
MSSGDFQIVSWQDGILTAEDRRDSKYDVTLRISVKDKSVTRAEHETRSRGIEGADPNNWFVATLR